MQTNKLFAGSIGCFCGDLHASCVVAESSDNQAAARDVNKFLQQLRGEQITDIIPDEPTIELRLSEPPTAMEIFVLHIFKQQTEEPW